MGPKEANVGEVASKQVKSFMQVSLLFEPKQKLSRNERKWKVMLILTKQRRWIKVGVHAKHNSICAYVHVYCMK